MPTADGSFARHVIWRADAPLPRLNLRNVLTYCPTSDVSVGCTLLRNGQVIDAFVLNGGSVAFFGKQSGLVEMDSAGAFVREIGSVGRVPGTYARVSALGGDARGTVTVWDLFASRVTTYAGSDVRPSATIFDPELEAVFPARDHAIGVFVPKSKSAGDRVVATTSTISPAGKRTETLAKVQALATRKPTSEFHVIPSFFWRAPVGSARADGSFLYVPPDTVVRIEEYDRSGHPLLLITGKLDVVESAVTGQDIRREIDNEYETVTKEHAGAAIDSCAHAIPGRTGKSAAGGITAVQCLTLRYLEAVGRRSPRVRPPIVGIVQLSPNGFWVRTSATVRDSTEWILADSAGAAVGYTLLAATQRLLGGTSRKIAIADIANGKLSVSWRSVRE